MKKTEYARLRLKLFGKNFRKMVTGRIRKFYGVRKMRAEQLEFRF